MQHDHACFQLLHASVQHDHVQLQYDSAFLLKCSQAFMLQAKHHQAYMDEVARNSHQAGVIYAATSIGHKTERSPVMQYSAGQQAGMEEHGTSSRQHMHLNQHRQQGEHTKCAAHVVQSWMQPRQVTDTATERREVLKGKQKGQA